MLNTLLNICEMYVLLDMLIFFIYEPPQLAIYYNIIITV